MKALKDYSFIRGFCHPLAWFEEDEKTLRKELGYAKRLNLNSARIWLMKEKYIAHIVNSLKSEDEKIIMWDIMNEPSCND